MAASYAVDILHIDIGYNTIVVVVEYNHIRAIVVVAENIRSCTTLVRSKVVAVVVVAYVVDREGLDADFVLVVVDLDK